MLIENHQTRNDATATHTELRNLMILLLSQQQLARKRLIWNSILLLLNFSSVAGLYYLLGFGYFII